MEYIVWTKWHNYIAQNVVYFLSAISTHVLYKEFTVKNISRHHFILQLKLEMQQNNFSASSVKNMSYQVDEAVNEKI